jgi:hypothetical protein
MPNWMFLMRAGTLSTTGCFTSLKVAGAAIAGSGRHRPGASGTDVMTPEEGGSVIMISVEAGPYAL